MDDGILIHKTHTFYRDASILVLERVAKSRVSNSSGTEKSDSGRVGWEFQKVGLGYPKSQVFLSGIG